MEVRIEAIIEGIEGGKKLQKKPHHPQGNKAFREKLDSDMRMMILALNDVVAPLYNVRTPKFRDLNPLMKL